MKESIQFAEWIAENHFKMVNVEDGEYYWFSESYDNVNYSTYDLWYEFKTRKV